MAIRKWLLILLSLLLASCSQPNNPPETVSHVDLPRYMGTWYEIAAFPAPFQKGCRCTKAQYKITEHHVTVTNSCIKSHAFSQAHAKAFPVEGSHNAKLKVQFFWPFKSNYWVIYLDKNYQTAIVSSPSRKYLWILSRTRSINHWRYLQLVRQLKTRGFNINKLRLTSQIGCDTIHNL